MAQAEPEFTVPIIKTVLREGKKTARDFVSKANKLAGFEWIGERVFLDDGESAFERAANTRLYATAANPKIEALADDSRCKYLYFVFLSTKSWGYDKKHLTTQSEREKYVNMHLSAINDMEKDSIKLFGGKLSSDMKSRYSTMKSNARKFMKTHTYVWESVVYPRRLSE